MSSHGSSDEMLKNLDNILSKINAMEIISSSNFEKNAIKIMRSLTEGQMHSIREFDHLKKAINLLTEQIFKTQNEIRDKCK